MNAHPGILTGLHGDIVESARALVGRDNDLASQLSYITPGTLDSFT
jgi:hypothetical protein